MNDRIGPMKTHHIPALAALIVLATRTVVGQPTDPSLTGPPILFEARMSADAQTAPTESPGTGLAQFSLDRSDLKLTWTVTFAGLTSAPTAVHIHGPARLGDDGPPVIDIAATAPKSPLKGSAILSEIQLELFLKGRVYVNVHTTKYPKGELRGQIERVRQWTPSPN